MLVLSFIGLLLFVCCCTTVGPKSLERSPNTDFASIFYDSQFGIFALPIVTIDGSLFFAMAFIGYFL